MSIKHLAGALSLSLALGIAACGGDDSSSSDSGDSTTKQTSGSTATKSEGPVKIAFSAPGNSSGLVMRSELSATFSIMPRWSGSSCR